MNKLIAYLILPLVLIGCATGSSMVKWNSIYGVPVNSTVSLLQPLTIRVRDTQAFLQDGIRIQGQSYDQYYPFCYFEIYTLASAEQTIEPDVFTITAVSREETQIVQTAPIKLASLIAFNVGGARSMTTQLTIMRIHSEKQPDVRKLVCAGGFDDTHDTELPTIQEISHALGDIAKLNIIRN